MPPFDLGGLNWSDGIKAPMACQHENGTPPILLSMESRFEKSWCAKLLPAITIMIAGRAPTTTLPARSPVAAFTAEDVSGGGIVVATSFTLPNIRHIHTLLVKSLGSHYVRDPLHPDRSVINCFHRFVNHHWGRPIAPPVVFSILASQRQRLPAGHRLLGRLPRLCRRG